MNPPFCIKVPFDPLHIAESLPVKSQVRNPFMKVKLNMEWKAKLFD